MELIAIVYYYDRYYDSSGLMRWERAIFQRFNM